MFEDSLVESQNRIHTHSRWFAIASFLGQGALLMLMILVPLFHPQALPKMSLSQLLVAPPPPVAPPRVQPQQSVSRPAVPATSLILQLQAPSRIPASISTSADPAPPSSWPAGASIGEGGGGTVPDGLLSGVSQPIVTMARPVAPKRPLAISSGVAAGQLLSPIQPTYPAIAKQARIQGTVVIEANISRSGTIDNLRVVEGPPLLRQAAIDALARARYRPFLLNGDPVEVQTTIRVIFSLGG